MEDGLCEKNSIAGPISVVRDRPIPNGQEQVLLPYRGDAL